MKNISSIVIFLLTLFSLSFAGINNSSAITEGELHAALNCCLTSGST